MSVSDIRIQLSLPGNPKYRRLVRAVGAAAMHHLVCLWIAVASNKPDGRLTGWDATDIAVAADWTDEPAKLIEHLERTGWLDRNGEGYVVHDWHDHQPWVCGAPQRSEAGRTGGKASGVVRSHKAAQRKAGAAAAVPDLAGSPDQPDDGHRPSDQGPPREPPTEPPHESNGPFANSERTVGEQRTERCEKPNGLRTPSPSPSPTTLPTTVRGTVKVPLSVASDVRGSPTALEPVGHEELHTMNVRSPATSRDGSEAADQPAMNGRYPGLGTKTDQDTWRQRWVRLFESVAGIYPKKTHLYDAGAAMFYWMLGTGKLTEEMVRTSVVPMIRQCSDDEDWKKQAGRFVPQFDAFLENTHWKPWDQMDIAAQYLPEREKVKKRLMHNPHRVPR